MINFLMVILLIILGLIVFVPFLLYVLVSFITSLFIYGKKDYKKGSKFCRFLIYTGTWFCLVFCRIKIDARGLENIPNDKRFLLVSNHRSGFDPIVTWWVLKKYDIAFVSKISNSKVPIFWKLVKRCCFTTIDRDNPREAIKTINTCAELIKNDAVSVGIYPEGTRTKTGDLLEFHNGVFKIAQKANAPIVVLALNNTESVRKRVFLKKTKVSLDFVKTYSEDYVLSLGTQELGEQIRSDMEKSLNA